MTTAAAVTVPAPRRSALVVDPTDLLDALPDATAVLDRDGVIVAVNRAWLMFTVDNGGDPSATGVGVSYLDVCARAAASGCEDAAEVMRAILAVLAGASVEQVLDYPCPSPAVGRWYALRITPVPGTGGVLVSHSNITRRKTAELDLARQASQDPLTGLANRTAFDRALARALTPRNHTPPLPDVGVLFLDLDGFKPVNDRFGHAAGDEVLQTVSARLREALRPQDTLARLGGDEFAVVLPRVTSTQLEGVAARLRACLAVPHAVHAEEVLVTASVGTCVARLGDDPAEVLARADAAMYEDKRRRHGVPAPRR